MFVQNASEAGEQHDRVHVTDSGDVTQQLHALMANDALITIPSTMASAFPGPRFGLRNVPVDDLAPGARYLIGPGWPPAR